MCQIVTPVKNPARPDSVRWSMGANNTLQGTFSYRLNVGVSAVLTERLVPPEGEGVGRRL